MSEHELIDSGPVLETAGLIHRVHRPNGPGPHRTAVLLHGLRGDEDVMWIFARTLPASNDWLLVAPRGPAAQPEGGYAWHSHTGQGWPALNDFTEGIVAVTRLVNSLPGLYQADPNNVYLIGFSQGAAIGLSTAASQPGLVRGVAALMGFLPQGAADGAQAGGLDGLPVFMAAGLRDQTVPIELARLSAQAARQAGANLEYREYDTGHKMNVPAMDDLKAWWRQTV